MATTTTTRVKTLNQLNPTHALSTKPPNHPPLHWPEAKGLVAAKPSSSCATSLPKRRRSRSATTTASPRSALSKMGKVFLGVQLGARRCHPTWHRTHLPSFIGPWCPALVSTEKKHKVGHSFKSVRNRRQPTHAAHDGKGYRFPGWL